MLTSMAFLWNQRIGRRLLAGNGSCSRNREFHHDSAYPAGENVVHEGGKGAYDESHDPVRHGQENHEYQCNSCDADAGRNGRRLLLTSRGGHTREHHGNENGNEDKRHGSLEQSCNFAHRHWIHRPNLVFHFFVYLRGLGAATLMLTRSSWDF